MGIKEHPLQGSVVTVDYSKGGFKEPEMMKRRLAVVLSPKIIARPHLCTIVPLSLTEPEKIMPYHKCIRIPFALPREWGDHERWVKGDMVNAVGFPVAVGEGQSGQATLPIQCFAIRIAQDRKAMHLTWHGPVGVDKTPLANHIGYVSGSAHVIRV